jgi:solute carrier family 35 (UDP-sugar transporter), member A1/2/3
MSELVKLFTCMWLVFKEEGSSLNGLTRSLHTNIINQPLETLKVCVPSMVYVVQNNLLYVAASHLDAATYQVRTMILIRQVGLLGHSYSGSFDRSPIN